MQHLLERHPKAGIDVLVVWEPILPTDWMAPTSLVLGRISDRRVRQFWDPQHVVARRMAADARPPQPAPGCCDHDGVLWDLAAFYPSGAEWKASLPPAMVFDGPVYEMEKGLEEALAPGQACIAVRIVTAACLTGGARNDTVTGAVRSSGSTFCAQR